MKSLSKSYSRFTRKGLGKREGERRREERDKRRRKEHMNKVGCFIDRLLEKRNKC